MINLRKIISLNISLISFLMVALILALSIRGVYGNPTEDTLASPEFTSEGPLELSPERGRFALTYSLVEDKSYQFSLPVARFVLPDLAYLDGNYLSLFAPTVSILAIPGYVLGKILNIGQVGMFATSAFFALLNFILIYSIALKIGSKKEAAIISALSFVFATPSFAYAVTLYQHHISTFLILMSVYLLMNKLRTIDLIFIWLLYGISITVDYPNAILMLPIAMAASLRSISIKKLKDRVRLRIRVFKGLAVAALFVPIILFLFSNYKMYGNPFTLSGSLPRAVSIEENGQPIFSFSEKTSDVEREAVLIASEKSPLRFFNTRNILNGIIVHFVSFDRGIIFYAPIFIFGIIGGYFLYKQKYKYLPLFCSIIAANIILYSMWGDPWGGWAFGSRYLIPSYAIFAILSSVSLTKLASKKYFLTVFMVIFIYSVSVNALGALTSNTNPPSVEIQSLQDVTGKIEKYSFDRNLDLLIVNKSKSFIFRQYASKYLYATQYYFIIVSAIIVMSLVSGSRLYEKSP